MPGLTPVAEADAQDKIAQTYERLHELLGPDPLPEPFLIMGNVESFLRDFYMNFKKFVFNAGKLDEKTKAAIGLVISGHAHCPAWVSYFQDRCLSLGWEQTQLAELTAVATTNYMYNTFFKFRSLSGTDQFEGLPVGLRAHTFSGTTLDDKIVELVNLVISDVNACQPCVSGHVSKAEQLGLSNEEMLEAIQCAATVYAGAQFIEQAKQIG